MAKNGIRSVTYVLDYDSETKLYTGFCPSMKPVRFIDKDEDRVRRVVEDGIDLYLEKHPDHFDRISVKEV